MMKRLSAAALALLLGTRPASAGLFDAFTAAIQQAASAQKKAIGVVAAVAAPQNGSYIPPGGVQASPTATLAAQQQLAQLKAQTGQAPSGSGKDGSYIPPGGVQASPEAIAAARQQLAQLKAQTAPSGSAKDGSFIPPGGVQPPITGTLDRQVQFVMQDSAQQNAQDMAAMAEKIRQHNAAAPTPAPVPRNSAITAGPQQLVSAPSGNSISGSGQSVDPSAFLDAWNAANPEAKPVSSGAPRDTLITNKSPYAPDPGRPSLPAPASEPSMSGEQLSLILLSLQNKMAEEQKAASKLKIDPENMKIDPEDKKPAEKAWMAPSFAASLAATNQDLAKALAKAQAGDSAARVQVYGMLAAEAQAQAERLMAEAKKSGDKTMLAELEQSMAVVSQIMAAAAETQVQQTRNVASVGSKPKPEPKPISGAKPQPAKPIYTVKPQPAPKPSPVVKPPQKPTTPVDSKAGAAAVHERTVLADYQKNAAEALLLLKSNPDPKAAASLIQRLEHALAGAPIDDKTRASLLADFKASVQAALAQKPPTGLEPGRVVRAGEPIKTQGGSAQVLLFDQSVVTVAPESEVTINRLESGKNAVSAALDIAKGSVDFQPSAPQLRIELPAAVLTARNAGVSVGAQKDGLVAVLSAATRASSLALENRHGRGVVQAPGAAVAIPSASRPPVTLPPLPPAVPPGAAAAAARPKEPLAPPPLPAFKSIEEFKNFDWLAYESQLRAQQSPGASWVEDVAKVVAEQNNRDTFVAEQQQDCGGSCF